MDSRHFDALARAISGEGGSRREALRLVIGGGLAALLGSVAGEDTEAAGRRGRGRRRRKGKGGKKKNKKKPAPAPAGPTCAGTNAQCHTNTPGECCSQTCCDAGILGDNFGVCASGGGVCCTVGQRGGYCAATTPNCCGTNSCCADPTVTPSKSKCCTTSQGQGFCCDSDQQCCGDRCGAKGVPTCPVNAASIDSGDKGGGAPRGGQS
jgi:hypothetical protein